MNRREKHALIYKCYQHNITDPQAIFAMAQGWGTWTTAHVEKQLNRIRQSKARLLSPQSCGANSTNPIERINNTPVDDLCFKDFLRLKVGGRDEFSALWGKRLESKVSQDILARLQETFPHDRKSQHSAIRWVLRGLETTRAIRKVETDLAVSENAEYAREEKEFWESEGAEDFALDMMKEGEDMAAMIHPTRQTEFEIGGYTVIRTAPNLATIVSSHGEVLVEKKINNEKHWKHFLKKFQESEEYRSEVTQGR